MAEEADSRTVQVSRSQLIRSGIFTSTDLASDCYQAIKLYAKKPSSIFYGQIAVMFAPGILFLIFGSSLGGLGPSTALIFGTLKYHTKIIFQKMIFIDYRPCFVLSFNTNFVDYYGMLYAELLPKFPRSR